jgi:hypothetical protein
VIADRFGVERIGDGHVRLVARVAFRAGDVLSPLTIAERLEAPLRHTLQAGEAEHVLVDPPELRLVDHHCEPNAFFDLDRGELVALADVAPGDPVTAFYPATEWSMAEPFACHCGALRCLGTVDGASGLAPAVLAPYRLSRLVARRLEARSESRAPG